MDACTRYEALIAERLFGTLNDADAARLDAHLAACPGCRTTVAEMKATLQVTAARPGPEPDDAFWDGYHARLMARIAEEASPAARQGRLIAWLRDMGHAHLALLGLGPRWAMQVAGAVALLAAGILIGWLVFSGSNTGTPNVADAPQPVETPATPEPPMQDEVAVEDDTPVPLEQLSPPPSNTTEQTDMQRTPEPELPTLQPASLDARTSRYLERSKILLLGLVNMETEGETPAMSNVQHKQAVARELVNEAGTLRAELSEADRQRLESLVADLEVILMQIANLEAGYDVPAIELVKSGVERQGLLLKINLTEMQKPDS